MVEQLQDGVAVRPQARVALQKLLRGPRLPRVPEPALLVEHRRQPGRPVGERPAARRALGRLAGRVGEGGAAVRAEEGVGRHYFPG